MKILNKLLLFIIIIISGFVKLHGQQGPADTAKIFPGATGYGTEFHAAYEGSSTPTILIVDTLYAGSLNTGTNRGSLQWCMQQNFPRIIVFEVGGVIDYSNSSSSFFTVNQNNMTVWGQTAPSPVTVVSQTIYINTGVHDILVQHMAFRHGDYPRPDGSIRIGDALTILSAYNIVFDHCTFSWGNDEVFSCDGYNSTISNSLIYEGLDENYHVDEGSGRPENHNFGSLFGGGFYNSTSYRNIFGGFLNRMPRVDADSFVVANNYAIGYARYGPDLNPGTGGRNNGALLSNFYDDVTGYSDSQSGHYVYFRPSMDTISKVFMENNVSPRITLAGGNQRDGIFPARDNTNPYYPSEEEVQAILVTSVDSSTVDVSDYELWLTADLLDSLQVNAGSWNWDRDYYDSLYFTKLQGGTVEIINSTRALPARAYSKSVVGDMSGGYDFSSNNVSFTVDGTTINLTTNLASVSAVVSAIDAQMPAGTECIKFPNDLSDYILLQTTTAAAGQSIVIAGDTEVLGIPAGTYDNSQDALYPDFPTTVYRHTLSIPSNPHDLTATGYTNIQNWADTLQGQGAPIAPDTCLNLSITGTKTDETNSLSNGSITTNVSGGTSPYTYAWDDGPTTADRTGLSAGSYSVTVTDDIGCTDDESFNIQNIIPGDTTLVNKFRVNFAPPTHSYTGDGTWNNKTVFNTTDSIQILDTTGSIITDMYMKFLSANWSGPSSTLGVSKTGYDDSVSVSLGLAYSQIDRSERTVQITNFPEELAYITLYCVRTASASNRRTTVTTNKDTITINSATSSDFGYVNAEPDGNGTLSFNLTPWTDTGVDSSDYLYLNFIEVEVYDIEQSSDPLDVNLLATDVTCSGSSDGTITTTPSGGVTPYTYLWDDGPTTQNRTGLSVGWYKVTVTDFLSNTVVDSIQITQIEFSVGNVVTQQPTCSDGTNGAATILPSGGTPPYTYNWPDGANVESRTDLSVGTYYVEVTDAAGCMESTTVNVTSTHIPIILNAVVTDERDGDGQGAIDLTVTGGEPDYTYLWTPDGETTQDISGKSAGQYTVTVTDGIGCTKFNGWNIANIPPDPESSAVVILFLEKKIEINPNQAKIIKR